MACERNSDDEIIRHLERSIWHASVIVSLNWKRQRSVGESEGGKRTIYGPCDQDLIDTIRFAASVWYSDWLNRLQLFFFSTFEIQLLGGGRFLTVNGVDVFILNCFKLMKCGIYISWTLMVFICLFSFVFRFSPWTMFRGDKVEKMSDLTHYKFYSRFITRPLNNSITQSMSYLTTLSNVHWMAIAFGILSFDSNWISLKFED